MLTLNDSQVETLQEHLQTLGQFVSDELDTRRSSMLPAEEGSGDSNYVIAALGADDAVDSIWKLIRGARAESPELDNSELENTARERAREAYEEEGVLEFDDLPAVSFAEDGVGIVGAYVSSWSWVGLADIVECECGRKRDQCSTFDGEKEHSDR
jgi:hypothetical protein